MGLLPTDELKQIREELAAVKALLMELVAIQIKLLERQAEQ